MKVFAKTLALAALALGFAGTSTFAEGGRGAGPNAIRCAVCGAEYQVITMVDKNNVVKMKLERIQTPATAGRGGFLSR
jgi:hypothetical protein